MSMSQAEHKIQSRGDTHVCINLLKVPKALGVVRYSWLPESMIVSFKLETDESILIEKARNSIKAYHVDFVVANLLHNRKDVVLLVDKHSVDEGPVEIQRPENVPAIEILLIETLVQKHKLMISTAM
jgi:phosphopantothenate-cysteine ligase